jgi:hypothetical protein
MQHPAVQGIHYICKAFYVMDVWATDISTITLQEIVLQEIIEVKNNSDGDTIGPSRTFTKQLFCAVLARC